MNDSASRSPEYRLGDLLLNRLRLRAPLGWAEWACLRTRFQAEIARAAWERRAGRPRVLATACWNFPIYSQTFVYQELTQLAQHGYDLRFVFSHLEPRDHLPPAFERVWDARRHLTLHRSIHRAMRDRYLRTHPEEVRSLFARLAQASGRSLEFVAEHPDVLQGFSFARLVEAVRPDYLHTYFFQDRTLMGLIASAVLGIPRGVSAYADHMLDDHPLKVVPLHIEQAEVVVATSRRIKDELVSLAPTVNPDKILVKPNAIDASRWSLPARSEVPSEPHRLVSVCRLEPKKGLHILLQAMAELQRSFGPCVLHLVGEADVGIAASQTYAEQLREQHEALALGGSVVFEGRLGVEAVREQLARAHLFVAPFVETEAGDKDGVPTALLEAMASGLPVVATTAGSISEVVSDDVQGRLVPPGDAGALAAAIESLLRAPHRRTEMAEAAVVRVREEYDISTCEPRFHARVDAVVEASRGRA